MRIIYPYDRDKYFSDLFYLDIIPNDQLDLESDVVSFIGHTDIKPYCPDEPYKKSHDTADKVCLSVSEAADMLGVCRGTVQKLIRAGKLKALHLDKRILIRKVDLHEFVNSLPEYKAP